jgi:hypothetical protein
LFVQADPMWCEGELQVAEFLRNPNESLKKVRFLIRLCLTWRDWSETRWCKVHSAGTRWIRSVCLGVDSIVQFVLADSCASTSLIHGYKKASREVREYLVIATVSAQGPETVAKGLFEDDRFFMVGASLRGGVEQKIDQISKYSQLIWKRLAAVVDDGVSYMDLRHKCLYAILIGGAYLQMDVFSDLERMPYALTQGDIAANVQRINETSEEHLVEELPLKIKRGLGVGLQSESFVDGLAHWKTASCSVAATEQGHALTAQLAQAHTQYHTEHLQDRATLSALIPYVVDQSPFERKNGCLEAQLEKLNKKQPDKINASSVFSN